MNDNGEHIGGVVGSLKSIGFQIREFNPTRVVILFDGKGGSDSRKKIFEGYKSDRAKNRFRVNRAYPELMNEEDEQVSMKRQFVWLVNMLDCLPVTTMIYDGIEADDVIGYLAKQILKEDEQCVIASTDKDFLQLVDSKTIVYSPTKKKTYTANLIREEYGISPQNFLFYRVLDGDKSDNVPGIDGCGLKTIIKRFPELCEDREVSLDELYQICENRVKEAKVYQNVLNNKNIIDRNIQIMQLSDPTISTSNKLKIIDRFAEPNKPLNKIEFIKAGMQHKVLESWKDINDWLVSTFNNIVVN
jgi:DNA polymerase-1